MHVPSNMTEQEVIDQIQIVVDRIAPKYTFYGYQRTDLIQEAFIICMEALPRYDETRPLENFLSVHLSNRLKNFVRDNYFQADENEKEKQLDPMITRYEHLVNWTYSNQNAEIKRKLMHVEIEFKRLLKARRRSQALIAVAAGVAVGAAAKGLSQTTSRK